VGTTCTLLSYGKLFVVVNGAIRTTVDTKHAPGALIDVDDDQSIGSGVYGIIRTGLNARGILAVLTRYCDVVHEDLGGLPDFRISLYSRPHLASFYIY
jgi:hypothetical protein